MAGLKGTPAERAALKQAIRRANEVRFATARAQRARDGHEKALATAYAMQAASKRMTSTAAWEMAVAVAAVVERFDVKENWR